MPIRASTYLPLLALAWTSNAVCPGSALAGSPPLDLPAFAVGRITFDEVDSARTDRRLTVDAWYPVDIEDATGPFSVYRPALESTVAIEGARVSTRERFPLIVFSHGSDGVRWQSFFLSEALARHGFIVVAPDHTGNTAADLLQPGADFETRDRPLDVSFVITRMLARNEDPDGPFFNRIDPLRIGVTGHSFGGFTALAVAGGFNDVAPDERIRAIMPIATTSSAMESEALERIGVPTLILGGTEDTITPIDPESIRPFELIGAVPRYRVDLIGGGHMSFTNICDILQAMKKTAAAPPLVAFVQGLTEQGCSSELIPINDAHRITILYAVAFLKRFVARESQFGEVLTPEFVETQDIPVVFSQETGSAFLRGDCNDDGAVDISDAVSTLGSLFLGDGDPGCEDACDSNDDGAVDISDAINTLGVLFLGNGAIPLPGVTACGVDPTDDELGCDAFGACP